MTIPRVNDRETQRAIEAICAEIQKLQDRLPTTDTVGSNKANDEVGTLRMIKVGNGDYRIEIKFKEGYMRSTSGTFVFREIGD